MFWIPLVMAGMSLLNSAKANKQAKAQDTINEANTEIANIQRVSQNEQNAATGALNRMNQSLANRDMLRAGGQQIESIRAQQIAMGNKLTTGTFTARLQTAAESGALYASAGSMGVGGGTVDVLNHATKLQADMAEGENRKAYDQAYFAGDRAADETLYQMYNQMSQVTYVDNIQAGEIVGPPKTANGSMSTAFLNAGMSFLSSAYSTGEFSKGGSLDLSSNSSFGRFLSGGSSQPNYQIGARLIGE